MGKRTLIIAGGGTGGHVLAGVAVADAWKARFGDESEVIFIGSRGGAEERLVPRAGYRLEVLDVGSLNRVSIFRRIRTIVQLPFALFRSLQLILRSRPDAVLGVGGYSSGPVVLVASILGCFLKKRLKTAVLEQNVIPGFTNRLLGRWVHLILAAFPGTEQRFPRKKVVITGNPIRSQLKPMPPAARDPFTVFIFGGSQGAVGINSLVLEALPFLEDIREQLRFIHQTGEKDYGRVAEAYQRARAYARIEKFIHEMAAAYAQASLVICRSGSSTLAEIAAIGRAAIFIPFPFAADEHQEKNARVFSEAGAGYLLRQQEATGERLARLIRELREDPARLRAVETSVRGFYRPDAAYGVVRELM